MKPLPARPVRPGRLVSICASSVLSLAGLSAGAATHALVVPAGVAASAAQPARISPYVLASRRHAAAAAASAPGLPSVPPSMRHGRQGLSQAPLPGAGVAGS